MPEREIPRFPPSALKTVIQLLYDEVTRNSRHEQGATWLANYAIIPLDIGFYTRETQERKLVKLRFQGNDDCIGICIIREGETEEALIARLKETQARIRARFPDLGQFSIVAATEEGLKRILIEKTSQEQAVDTLHPETTKQTNPLYLRTLELLNTPENRTLLEETSISITKKGQLDFLFVDAEPNNDEGRMIRPLNVKNLRVARLRKETVEEEILDEAICAGIYVPDVNRITEQILSQDPSLQEDPERLRNEVKHHAYTTAEYIRRSLIPFFELDREKRKFYVAVALDGQLALWEKMGLLQDIPPFREGAVTPREIIKALFYENGQKTGPLAKLGIKFRTRSIVVEGLDLSFYTRDEDGIAHPAGLTMWGYGKDLQKLTPYNNVIGIVAVEDDLPLSKRKLITRRLTNSVKYWLINKETQILQVDRRLLKLWEERGGPLVLEEEKEAALREMSSPKRLDYGFGPTGDLESATLYLFEKQQQIGGNQLILSLSYPGQIKRAVLLDWGWPYATEPVISGFPNRPSYALGLNPYLESGILPQIRRLYRTDLLQGSLNYQSLRAALTGNSFIVGELYHRLGWEQLHAQVAEKVPQFTDFHSLQKQLEVYEQQNYTNRKTIFDAVLITHAHQDHVGAGFAIRDEIPFGGTPETAAFLRGSFRSGWHYTTQEPLIRRLRENGKRGNSYDLHERLYVPFDDGQTRAINLHVTASSHYVDHSIYGSTAYQVAILDPHGATRAAVAYLGDFRAGPQTEQAIYAMKNANVLIIEGSNFETKPSVGVTEEQVAHNLEILRQKADSADGLFVVQFPPNHLERLKRIVEASGQRQVCVSLSVAQILHEFAILNESLPPNRRIDTPQLGKDVLIFKHKILPPYDPWQEQLMKTYGAVTMNDIVPSPMNFTLTLSPYQLLENVFEGTIPQGLRGGVVVRSSYWPYGAQDKQTVLSNFRFCRRNGLEFQADIDLTRNQIMVPQHPLGLHASGHATPDELLQYIETIAAGNQLKVIVPLHTLSRGFYSSGIFQRLRQQGIKVYPEEKGVRVVSRVGKGRFAIPIPLE